VKIIVTKDALTLGVFLDSVDGPVEARLYSDDEHFTKDAAMFRVGGIFRDRRLALESELRELTKKKEAALKAIIEAKL